MSLGKDLSTIRKEKNLTLEDVFSTTKIPVHTLESIEKDAFLNQKGENKTYLRSFVRSYAKALKISDEHILAAIEATEAGIYNNDLIRLTHPDAIQEEFSLNKDHVEIAETSLSSEESSENQTEEKKSTSDEENTEGTSTFTDPTRARSPKSAPTVETVNWADMSRKVYSSPTNPKVFLGIFIAIVFIGIVFASYYYSENIASFFSSEEVAETETPTTAEPTENEIDSPITSAIIDSVETPSTVVPQTNNSLFETTANPFGDTLKIVLYAAFDKLDPVRVTSDFNWRTNPFWMDQGEASYFEFKDSLLVRGQYSQMLLMFNGHLIENPRQNYFDSEYNSILLTREILNQPKYREASTEGFPLNVTPPDSIVYLIRY